ncbi:phage minor tail protein L [Chromobacterium subtsugae]|uniref:phage minor tail protein L n=1 Tax=Chromobacterium subtsugae TaxID=251747 RepID=UPI0007F8B72F|nr:phage minor tail protein L [Chromobacterium subtsugae]
MQIQQDVQGFILDARVELFQLAPPPGTPYPVQYFTPAGTDANTNAISFMGQQYQPWAIQAEGFEKTVQGSAPRPTLSIANAVMGANGPIYGIFTQLVRQFRGLAGWRVTRMVTYAKYLDGGALAGAPEFHQQEIWFVNRRTQDDGTVLQFELVSALDLEGKTVPNTMASVYCPAQTQYRSAACGYAGAAMFDVDGMPTNDPSKDACGKHFSDCQRRGNQTNYPGLLGLRRYG